MNRKILTFLTFVIAFGLAVIVPTETQAAGKVKLNKSKLVLAMDSTYQLQLKNTDSEADWTSSDESVVEVEQGDLTPVSMGTATVTARVDGKAYSCKVTVIDYEGMSLEQMAVVSYALKYVGNSYRYGGTSLTNGTDCSGFTLSVYKKFGYDLERTAYQQLCSTKKVSKKKLKPGDLIFYGSSKRSCSHVAMYIGNNKIVHASTESTGIIVSNYDYRKAVGYGRVLEQETYQETDDTIARYATSGTMNN